MSEQKIIEFRKLLAEQGNEFTLSQAKMVYEAASNLIKRSKRLSQLDLWNMQDLDIDGMTEEEKQGAISLYQHIRDFS